MIQHKMVSYLDEELTQTKRYIRVNVKQQIEFLQNKAENVERKLEQYPEKTLEVKGYLQEIEKQIKTQVNPAMEKIQ